MAMCNAKMKRVDFTFRPDIFRSIYLCLQFLLFISPQFSSSAPTGEFNYDSYINSLTNCGLPAPSFYSFRPNGSQQTQFGMACQAALLQSNGEIQSTICSNFAKYVFSKCGPVTATGYQQMEERYALFWESQSQLASTDDELCNSVQRRLGVTLTETCNSVCGTDGGNPMRAICLATAFIEKDTETVGNPADGSANTAMGNGDLTNAAADPNAAESPVQPDAATQDRTRNPIPTNGVNPAGTSQTNMDGNPDVQNGDPAEADEAAKIDVPETDAAANPAMSGNLPSVNPVLASRNLPATVDNVPAGSPAEGDDEVDGQLSPDQGVGYSDPNAKSPALDAGKPSPNQGVTNSVNAGEPNNVYNPNAAAAEPNPNSPDPAANSVNNANPAQTNFNNPPGTQNALNNPSPALPNTGTGYNPNVAQPNYNPARPTYPNNNNNPIYAPLPNTNANNQYAPNANANYQYAPNPNANNQYAPNPNANNQYAPNPNANNQYAPNPNANNQYVPNPNANNPYAPNPNGNNLYNPNPNANNLYAPNKNPNNPYPPNYNPNNPYPPNPNANNQYAPNPNANNPYVGNQNPNSNNLYGAQPNADPVTGKLPPVASNPDDTQLPPAATNVESTNQLPPEDKETSFPPRDMEPSGENADNAAGVEEGSKDVPNGGGEEDNLGNGEEGIQDGRQDEEDLNEDLEGDEQAGMEPGEGGPDSRDGGEELEYESPEERDDEEPEDDGAGYDEDQFNGEEEEEEEDWRNENEEEDDEGLESEALESESSESEIQSAFSSSFSEDDNAYESQDGAARPIPKEGENIESEYSNMETADDGSVEDDGNDNEEYSIDDDEQFNNGPPENNNANVERPNLREEVQAAKRPVKDPVIYEVKEDSASSHFLAYSLTAIILIMATYLLYHNKQKIIAIIIEGKSTTGRRRGGGGAAYSKLDQNVSEAMPSLQETKETSKDYTF